MVLLPTSAPRMCENDVTCWSLFNGSLELNRDAVTAHFRRVAGDQSWPVAVKQAICQAQPGCGGGGACLAQPSHGTFIVYPGCCASLAQPGRDGLIRSAQVKTAKGL